MKLLKYILILIAISESLGLHPVLLVPGDGGSQLTAQFSKTPPHYICGRQDKSFLLWLNLYFMLPITLDCFVKTISLEYNSTTKRTSSPDFCDVYAGEMGSTESISYLSNLKIEKTSYFYYIINELIQNHGYILGKSLRGAPFDFRKSPSELHVLSDLHSLIEMMYKENNNQSVIIIGHSLGNLYLNLLLSTMTQQWKDTYIKTFISISGPYLGAVDAIRTAMSGNNENIFTVNPIKVRPALSSWPSTYFLMPSPKFRKGKPIVATKYGVFTSDTLVDLLYESQIPYAVDHYQNTSPILAKLKPPRTSLYCIYSNDVQTPKYLDYRSGNFPNDQPLIVHGPGDGTVNYDSLYECSKWKDFQNETVITHTISNVSHLEILRDEKLLTLLSNIIKELNYT